MRRIAVASGLFALALAACGGGGGDTPTGTVAAAPSPAAVPSPAPAPSPAPSPTALQLFLDANYDQPNPHNQATMPSPPAIAVTTAAPAGLTAQYRYTSNGAALTYTGGREKAYATVYRRFPVATMAATGGNTDGGTQATAWRVGASITASRVAARVLGTSVPYRFIVDGRYVDATGTLTIAGGTNYMTVDFGTSAKREIWVEGEKAGGFDGFALAPGDTIEKVAAPKRIMFVGDSFTESTGATVSGDGYALVAGDILGFKDIWSSGVGATGYVADVGGTRYKLGARLDDVNTTGPWDIIVVAMGVNDMGLSAAQITTEATAALASIRTANPDAEIFVLGPFDTAAPAAPSGAYAATKAAIQAALGATGARFVDMQGVAFTKADATHPNTAGHLTLGRYVASQIKGALIP